MATELVDGVWRIDCVGVNAYLLDRGELVLVDAGTPLDAGTIREGVADAGHALADVDRVLVTHFDLDHVGALWRLDDELSAPVHAGTPDGQFLTRQATPPLSRKGLMHRAFRLFARPPALDVRPVADGDELAGLTAAHTPGHTPGHTVYADGEVAFLGDLVMERGERLTVPPWPLNYDTAEVGASIQEFAARTPDFGVAAMGHGDPLPETGAAALRALADRL